MRYVTSIERMAMERGEREGREEGQKEGQNIALRETVIKLLQYRFQLAESEITPLTLSLQSISEPSTLKQIVNLTLDAETLADFMTKFQFVLSPLTPGNSAVSSQEAPVIAQGAV